MTTTTKKQQMFRAYHAMRWLRTDLETRIEETRGESPVKAGLAMRVAECLLAIGLEEGKAQREIAALMGVSKEGVSRLVSILGEWSWKRRPGIGLVEASKSLYDRRTDILTLTREGRKVVDTYLSILETGRRPRR